MLSEGRPGLDELYSLRDGTQMSLATLNDHASLRNTYRGACKLA